MVRRAAAAEDEPVVGRALAVDDQVPVVAERLAPPEPDPNAPADEPPPEARYALTATRLGEDGLVIRVGLPQWARRLREPQVAQVTRNIIDLLRGQEPKIRSLR